MSLEHGYLKFENLTTLIKIINNSLVKELNINLFDVKQNLINIALLIKNNRLEMLGKLEQFGTYLNTSHFQIFIEKSSSLFSSTFTLLSNELTA